MLNTGRWDWVSGLPLGRAKYPCWPPCFSMHSSGGPQVDQSRSPVPEVSPIQLLSMYTSKCSQRPAESDITRIPSSGASNGMLCTSESAPEFGVRWTRVNVQGLRICPMHGFSLSWRMGSTTGGGGGGPPEDGPRYDGRSWLNIAPSLHVQPHISGTGSEQAIVGTWPSSWC